MNSDEHIINAVRAATASDEVVSLGVRLNAAQLRELELDDKQAAAREAVDFCPQGYFVEASHHAVDEAAALRSMLPYVKACTLTGAGIQIIAAMNLVDVIAENFAPNERPDVERDFRQVFRLLFSALGVVDGLADQKVADVIGMLVCPHIDPWTPVEERVASVWGAQ